MNNTSNPKNIHVALMPATVRVSPTKLVCCIRNLTAYPKVGWIESLMNGYQFPISRSRLSMLFLAGVLGLFSIASAQSPYLTTQGSAWRIASANVLGIGPKHLVYASYEGEAGCLDPRTGQTLGRTPIGGFPFGLATGDVNTDGRDEIFIACADGRLYAISPEGKISWTFSANNAAIYSVAIVRPGPRITAADCLRRDGPAGPSAVRGWQTDCILRLRTGCQPCPAG